MNHKFQTHFFLFLNEVFHINDIAHGVAAIDLKRKLELNFDYTFKNITKYSINTLTSIWTGENESYSALAEHIIWYGCRNNLNVKIFQLVVLFCYCAHLIVVCSRQISRPVRGGKEVNCWNPGPTFIKPDQRNPWIKDQLWNDLLSTILHLQLPNVVSCGRDKPSHMTQNLVTVGVKL